MVHSGFLHPALPQALLDAGDLLCSMFISPEGQRVEATDRGWGGGAGGKEQHRRDAQGVWGSGHAEGSAVLVSGSVRGAPNTSQGSTEPNSMMKLESHLSRPLREP